MHKIYYNAEGWVCERAPYNFEKTETFIEVPEELYLKTLITEQYFAWRVVNGQLVNQRYEKTPIEEILSDLRERREYECFSVVNRGVLWYNVLTEAQRLELDKWYKEWLDVTDRYVEGIDIETIIPKKPEWLT